MNLMLAVIRSRPIGPDPRESLLIPAQDLFQLIIQAVGLRFRFCQNYKKDSHETYLFLHLLVLINLTITFKVWF